MLARTELITHERSLSLRAFSPFFLLLDTFFCSWTLQLAVEEGSSGDRTVVVTAQLPTVARASEVDIQVDGLVCKGG